MILTVTVRVIHLITLVLRVRRFEVFNLGVIRHLQSIVRIIRELELRIIYGCLNGPKRLPWWVVAHTDGTALSNACWSLVEEAMP